MLNKSYIKNEKFYTKKRTLIRVAEQIKKQCDSDIFIVVHKKDTNKMFSYSTNLNFDLEKVSKLIQKDV